jgi:hypothetical protein
MTHKMFGKNLASRLKAPGPGEGTVGSSNPTVPELKQGAMLGHTFQPRIHFKWDFSVDGGAISTIQLNTANSGSGYPVPANALIYFGLLNIVTVPVGGGASIAFGMSAGVASGPTTCLKNTTAISGLTLDSIVAMVPVNVAAGAFKTTAKGLITMTISGAPLTAGLVEGWLFYLEAANA